MRQNIVISGGSKGIGKGIAKAFVENDCNIFIGARNEIDLKLTAEELQKLNSNIKIYYRSCDFTNENSVKDFLAEVKSKFKTIDVIINNVGSYESDSINDNDAQLAERMLKANYMSAYYLTIPLIADFIKNKSGHIFNILSVSALHPRQEAVSYSASKYAFKAFHLALLDELRTHNVKVTGVYPGATITESWGDIDGSAFLKPAEIAAAIINAWKLPASANIDEIIIRPTVPVN